MSYNCYIACYIAYMACYITGYITPSFLFLSLPCPAAALALIKISPTLLQAPLQGHCPLMPACQSLLLPPGLSFSHTDLSWLAPPVAPHPRAHLKEPAAVACARTRIGNSPLTTAKAVRKRWVFVAGNEAGYQRNTAQHIAHRAYVKTGLVASACSIVQHGDPVALHYRVWRDVDRLECAEKHQGQLHMTVLSSPLSSGANCAIKEQLRPGIPHEALAADVHVTLGVKIFRWVGIVWKWSD